MLLTMMLAIALATQEAVVGGLQVQGLLKLQSEFKAILGYLVRTLPQSNKTK